MINLFVEFLCLSVFISALTLGLRIISGKGMVLYPIRRWLFSFGEKKQQNIHSEIDRKQMLIKKVQSQKYTEDANIFVKSLRSEIENLEWQSFLVDAWHKPLLTCAPCMCSFYGILTTVYFYFLIGFSVVYVAPFSIFFSVFINYFLWNNYKL